MLEKIKKAQKNQYIKMLNDTRVLGLLAFGLVAVLVTWSGVKAVQTNYGLQKQIANIKQQNSVKKLENDNQRLRNEYYKTDEFLELAARRQFGKAAPGERVYLVPKKVARAYADVPKGGQTSSETPKTTKPAYQKNFESWMNFFLHRSQNQN